MKAKLYWSIVSAFIFLTCVACYGLGLYVQYLHYYQLPPKEIHTVVEVPKYTTITILDKQVEIEKVIIYPRYFISLDELTNWLAQDDTDSCIFANSLGSTANQCEDYAMQLMERAIKSGYMMSTETLYPAEYYQIYLSPMPANSCHMVNLVIIGNEAYIVDPSTDKIYSWHPLD
jgi:hypothetical protein